MKQKIGLVSLGCSKNLVDSEKMLGILKEAGYIFTSDESDADIIIVNTCGFIESAKKESIDTILEMAEYKKGKCKKLIVTGCLAQRYKDLLFDEMPEIDVILGTNSYEKILEALKSKDTKPLFCETSDLMTPSPRVLTSNDGHSYLKIAEGCDNHCTYCVIPKIRGGYNSRKMEDLVDEARFLAKSGVKELVIIAQDSTVYGKDLYGSKKLTQLIKELSKIDEIEWLRLLYCYPEGIDQELIEEFASNPKLCKYIDIPMQHASDNVLRRMGRKGNQQQLRELISNLKTLVPGMVIRTTFMVGFPGETKEDFEELCKFVEEMEFDRLGAFMYSKEEDTPAFKMRPQIVKKTKRERYDKIMSLQNNIVREKNTSRVGNVYKTLVQGILEDGTYFGRTYAEAPEADGLVYFRSKTPLLKSSFQSVKIVDYKDYDLMGVVENESAK